MSTVLKRSEGALRRAECRYGCCGPLAKDGHGKTGKNTRTYRRMVKRAEKRAWRKALDNAD